MYKEWFTNVLKKVIYYEAEITARRKLKTRKEYCYSEEQIERWAHNYQLWEWVSKECTFEQFCLAMQKSEEL